MTTTTEERIPAGSVEEITISPIDPYVILAGIRQFGLAGDRADLQDLERAIDRLVSARLAAEETGYRRGLEEAAKVAESQPYYPDTNIGIRQQWVKDQIAARIRALPRAASASQGMT